MRIPRLPMGWVAAAVIVAVSLIASRSGPVEAAPANDSFPGATITTLPFADTIDNTGATREVGEPEAVCRYYGLSGPEATVWYSFTPTDDIAVKVTIASSNQTTEVAAVLYTNSGFGGGGLLQHACAITRLYDPPSGLRQASFAYQVDAGREYWLQVGSGPPGNPPVTDISLEVEEFPALRHDKQEFAENLAFLPAVRSADFEFSTIALDEPQSSCTDTYSDYSGSLWYRYTATSDDLLFMRSGDVQHGYVATIYRDSGSELTELSCTRASPLPGYPYWQLMLGTPQVPGETYLIQILENVSYDATANSQRVTLRFENASMPECPAYHVRVADALRDNRYDGYGDPPGFVDISRIRIGTNQSVACIRIDFEEIVYDSEYPESPLPPHGVLSFDLDRNDKTGVEDRYHDCGMRGFGIDRDLFLDSYLPAGVTALRPSNPTGPNRPPPDPTGLTPPPYALVETFDDHITVVAPLASLGGDPEFAVTAVLNGSFGSTDCLPEGAAGFGGIVVEAPPAFRFGDADCDFEITAHDMTELLRYAADLDGDPAACEAVGQPLAQPFSGSDVELAGDVTCDGTVDERDVFHYLRRLAGLTSRPPDCPDLWDYPR